MNQDILTTEYLSQLKHLRLSDEARGRIQSNLLHYAAFHTVREDEMSRSIKVVPFSTSLFSFKFATMPFIILIAVMIGGGTTLAAQGAVPGDLLYPVKTGVNENIRGAFAMSADSEARLQASILEERLEEAQELQAKGSLTGETAQTVATNIIAQAKVASVAAQASGGPVATETKARIEMALKSFLSAPNLDTMFATSVSTSLFSTELATGLYDINDYRTDMKARTDALVTIMKTYQTKIGASVYTDLGVKLDEAIKLTADSQTQVEADARATLDQASVFAGEVESKLSTLGQVMIDSATGIITDIDFSINPMMIDRGDATTTSSTSASGTGAGVDINTNVNGSLDTDMIKSSTSASGGARIGL